VGEVEARDVLLSIKLKQELGILLSDIDLHPGSLLAFENLLLRRIFEHKAESPFPSPFVLVLVSRYAVAVSWRGLTAGVGVGVAGFVV